MARTTPSWLMTAAVLAPAIVLVGSVRDADACSCRPSPSAEAALTGADAVFEARVGAVTAPNSGGVGSTGAELQVPMKVVRSWKGASLEPGKDITITTPSGSSTCGYSFRANELYVVFAARTPSGGLATNMCMRTKRSADATDDIAALTAATSAPNPAQTGAPSAPASSSKDDSVPPFEATDGVPAVVVDAGPPPPPSPPAPAKKGGCAGCAVVDTQEGAPLGLILGALFALAATLRRARRLGDRTPL